MIARENAQATRIDGDGFVDAEFGAEVGYGPRLQCACVYQAPGGDGVQVLVQLPQGAVGASLDVHFRGALVQKGRIHFLEHAKGIAMSLVIELEVDVPEDGADFWAPGPPEVLGQLLELLLERKWVRHVTCRS